MSWELRICAEAEADLAESRTWYEDQCVGLGDAFLICVEEALSRLRRNPEWCQMLHNDVRRALVRRFPFAIYFRLEDVSINVLAIMDARRDPRQWQSRF